MDLILLYDFMQVLNSIRNHSTKNEYFPMHIIFTTIYLLQEQKLFWAGIEYEQFFISYWAWCAHVYQVWRLSILCIFVIKYSNIRFIGIIYKEIKHKYEFGQAYCKYLLNRILKKFYFAFFWVLFYFLWILKT
jgi:hypothetical protein